LETSMYYYNFLIVRSESFLQLSCLVLNLQMDTMQTDLQCINTSVELPVSTLATNDCVCNRTMPALPGDDAAAAGADHTLHWKLALRSVSAHQSPLRKVCHC